jgi:hypothetical protein
VILLVKSETGMIHVRQALESSVCQRTGPHENDFAISIKSAQEPSYMCKVGEYRSHTSEGQEKGRELFLNNHVAQFSFYDTKLASILTRQGKIGVE